MSRLPPKELLERVHQFPCDYHFKAIGPGHGDFLADVLSAVVAVLAPDAPMPRHTVRLAAGGRHQAVSVTVLASSADSVLAIYARLQAVQGLVALF